MNGNFRTPTYAQVVVNHRGAAVTIARDHESAWSGAESQAGVPRKTLRADGWRCEARLIAHMPRHYRELALRAIAERSVVVVDLPFRAYARMLHLARWPWLTPAVLAAGTIFGVILWAIGSKS